MQVNLPDLLKSVQLPKCDWMGLRYMSEHKRYFTVRDERPENVGSDLSQGLMIEVLVNGQFGYAATQEMTKQGLQDAAEHAFNYAKTASQWGLFKSTPAQRPTVQGSYAAPYVKPFDSLSVAEIYDVLRSACKVLKASDKIIKTAASTQMILGQSEYVTTSGTHIQQKFNQMMTHMEAIAREGSIVQRRTDNGYVSRMYQSGLEGLNADQLKARATQVAAQALELLQAKDCPTAKTNVVIAPDQMMLQIHESIGHPLELDRILGDERNYAGFSFVRPHDFGKLQIGRAHV